MRHLQRPTQIHRYQNLGMIDPLNNDGCVLITGAGSGIGQTTALQLNMMGVKTVLVGRTQSKLEATAAMLENRDLAYIYPRDLGEDPDGTTKWMQTIVAETGPLSGLVCLAGEQMIAPVGRVKAAQVQTLFTNNIFPACFWPRPSPTDASMRVPVAQLFSSRPFPPVRAKRDWHFTRLEKVHCSAL